MVLVEIFQILQSHYILINVLMVLSLLMIVIVIKYKVYRCEKKNNDKLLMVATIFVQSFLDSIPKYKKLFPKSKLPVLYYSILFLLLLFSILGRLLWMSKKIVLMSYQIGLSYGKISISPKVESILHNGLHRYSPTYHQQHR